MITLIFATNNQNKVDEIKSVVDAKFSIVSLQEAGINIDIFEPYNTLEENAKEKSRVIYAITGKNCFSEDTGLEVQALNGEPGVKSARYAGAEKNTENNTAKLLDQLKYTSGRKARFRTVISLIFNGLDYLFEGICEGEIAAEPRGNKGFGYDSIFLPCGSDRTFGEMFLHEKNIYSHRRKAVEKLALFLSINGKI